MELLLTSEYQARLERLKAGKSGTKEQFAKTDKLELSKLSSSYYVCTTKDFATKRTMVRGSEMSVLISQFNDFKY